MYCTNCGEQISEHAEICVKCGVPQFKIINNCYDCGNKINERQEICLKCGVNVRKTPSSKAVNTRQTKQTLTPIVYALLSFFIIGLGQIILGQVKKGVSMLIISFLISLITFGLASPICWIISAVDGYRIAKKVNEGKTIGEWEFF